MNQEKPAFDSLNVQNCKHKVLNKIAVDASVSMRCITESNKVEGSGCVGHFQQDEAREVRDLENPAADPARG